MLKVTDVETGYGDVAVLHGISLEVGEGESVALLGLNGAGKSTAAPVHRRHPPRVVGLRSSWPVRR